MSRCTAIRGRSPATISAVAICKRHMAAQGLRYKPQGSGPHTVHEVLSVTATVDVHCHTTTITRNTFLAVAISMRYKQRRASGVRHQLQEHTIFQACLVPHAPASDAIVYGLAYQSKDAAAQKVNKTLTRQQVYLHEWVIQHFQPPSLL
eukprot:GHUV01036320.1.p1 GENE.GHUV01036320.1~~GHUV01036320.1.p1  ORF type:complete len:149 (-),score=26.14 GHUV01036320.1:368-814(-)